LKGRTGLFLDESLPPYVHSGVGASYVKYFNVQKGETYYLLVDNVYNNGNGHTIHFHYKPIKPGESYIGQKNVLANVTFKDSDDEFKPGTKYIEAIDSLYKFLSDNPGIKIEVQGHVNTNFINKLGKVDGKPYRTDQELSQLRAEAVCKLLYKKGVDPERLVPNGYGGTMKKIPRPKNKEECYKNIRVEVLVMSLDYKRDPEYINKHKKQK
jgi:outer membrane protein OmpA-like peptidoglycan-associated protein